MPGSVVPAGRQHSSAALARRLAAVAIVLLAGGACDEGPKPIAIGSERCAFCLMGVAEERFASELITRTRKVHFFDSIECLAAFVAFDAEAENARSLWVTDYESPPRLIEAGKAFFLQAENVRSPMGLGLAAYSSRAARDTALRRAGGRALDWPAVIETVRQRWPEGSPHGSAHPREHGPKTQAGSGTTGMQGQAGASTAALRRLIEAAGPGERVVVPAGTYTGETLVIDKPLELVGEAGAVLDGGGQREIITVRSDDVTIRGLVLRNVGLTHVDDRAAIRVENASNCRIEGNRIEQGFFGIYLAKVRGCSIRGNELTASGATESASGNGIHLWSSSDVTIADNRVNGYRDGIYFEFVRNSHVSGNTSEHNLRYGLHFMFSDSCRYEHNRFRRNKAGVAVMYTTAVAMLGNTFTDNWGSATFGLLLKDIRDSRIEQNRFERNTVALYVEGSDRLTVAGNEFSENGWAVKIFANSERNRFEANNFAGNTFDVATNSRQNYSTFAGNYWQAYRGYDLDRDGTGDVPHRPVRLFSLLVERNEPSLILLRSFLVQLLDAAESLIPAITPETLVDERPLMDRASRNTEGAGA